MEGRAESVGSVAGGRATRKPSVARPRPPARAACTAGPEARELAGVGDVGAHRRRGPGVGMGARA